MTLSANQRIRTGQCGESYCIDREEVAFKKKSQMVLKCVRDRTVAS